LRGMIGGDGNTRSKGAEVRHFRRTPGRGRQTGDSGNDWKGLLSKIKAKIAGGGQNTGWGLPADAICLCG